MFRQFSVFTAVIIIALLAYTKALTFRQARAREHAIRSSISQKTKLDVSDAGGYATSGPSTGSSPIPDGSSTTSSTMSPTSTASSSSGDLPGTVPLAEAVPVLKPQRNLTKQALVAESELCQDMGTSILQGGGNAVDAAITTLLCNSVVHPNDGGLGSGITLNIYMRDTGKMVSIVGISKAPGASTEDMFDAVSGHIPISWRANAIPGFLAALREAHRLFGTVEWKSLFQPVIDLARKGVVIDQYLGGAIAAYKNAILDDPGLTSVFVKNPETNELYTTGDTLIQSQLAQTLETIANDPDYTCEFYKGSIADALVHDNQQGGGIWTGSDLRKYRVVAKESTQTKVHNSTLLTTALPSAGIIVAYFINMMRDITTWNVGLSAPQIFHQAVERRMHAYARMQTDAGDIDFEPELQGTLDNLNSKWYADHTSTHVIPDKAYNDTQAYGVASNQSDTANWQPLWVIKVGTAASVVDCFGNAVAAAGGFGDTFGSLRLSLSTGIILNDDMYEFETNLPVLSGLQTNSYNKIRPYKRPLIQTAPSIVLDSEGDVQLIVAGSGSTRAIGQQATVLVQTLLLGLDPKAAIDRKNLLPSLYALGLEYELGFPREYAVSLQNMGHRMFLLNGTAGTAQAIKINKEDGIILAYVADKVWSDEKNLL